MGKRKMLVLQIETEANAVKGLARLLQGQSLFGEQLHEVEVERVVDFRSGRDRQATLVAEGAEKPSRVEIFGPPGWTNPAAAQEPSLVLLSALIVHDTADDLNLARGDAPRQPTRAGARDWGHTSKFAGLRPTRSASGQGRAESRAVEGRACRRVRPPARRPNDVAALWAPDLERH